MAIETNFIVNHSASLLKVLRPSFLLKSPSGAQLLLLTKSGFCHVTKARNGKRDRIENISGTCVRSFRPIRAPICFTCPVRFQEMTMFHAHFA